MAKKFKIKNQNSSIFITVTLSLVINILIYAVLVFLVLFKTEFDWASLYPRWVLHGETVVQGTIGAWYDLGIFITSGIIQFLGIMLYFNTFWSGWIKKSIEPYYMFVSNVITKFLGLLTDKEFRAYVKALDYDSKVETWKIITSIKLQNLNNRLNAKIKLEYKLPIKEQSKKTRRFISKENDLIERLTDKWIKENIDHQKLKYPRISVQMILHGKTSISIERFLVEDTQKVINYQIISKVLFAVLSLGFIALFVALKVPELKEDVWNTVKDFLIYSIGLILNIIMGLISIRRAHDSRKTQTVDRLSHISNYVGVDKVEKAKAKVVEETKQSTIEALEQHLKELKKLE